MYRYGLGIRFFSLGSHSSRTAWDPTVSLQLNYPSLVLLEKCSSRSHLKQVLGQIMRSNLIGQTFPMSRLLVFSAISHPENLDMATVLFEHFTPHPNLFIYNTMISALSFSTSQSFALYNAMLRDHVLPDKHTLCRLLHSTKCMAETKQIHCHAIVTGLFPQGYLQNTLIKVYLDNRNLEIALRLLHHMRAPDSVSFNITIVGFAKHGFGAKALQLFHRMVNLGVEPDDFTILGLIVSCRELRNVKLGKSVHAWIQRRKDIGSSYLILWNALLDMYLKFKELELARKTFNQLAKKDVISWNTLIVGCVKSGELKLAHDFFDQMPCRDLVSWNSLIAGYAQNGYYSMVVELIKSMLAHNVSPDRLTMVSFICAAAEIGVLDQGKSVHGWVIKKTRKMDAFTGSALIDMYCKCGNVKSALTIFQELPKKDVVVWTTMITGFAFHGLGSKALELFAEMQKSVKPNEVTFVAILTACAHSGLVDQGIKVFHDMKAIFDIEPRVEHYGCLVDLLGRSGRLAEAKVVLDTMPMKPSRSVWGAMLSACRGHGNVELAEMALTKLLDLEPDKEGAYILLSNVYAACGRWSYSDHIREFMEGKGLKKTVGLSSVSIDGAIHNFVASDMRRLPSWEEMQHVCNFLNRHLQGIEPFSQHCCDRPTGCLKMFLRPISRCIV
ncbi:pentatricopeptide repeat-containing protein At3g04750, mitochondrial isoform X2 [Prosopis cineraria]|uniref:pentatricopeptide repeat-containing protein At3g04750, mitochondrial isoform X2 n=1 Tax=Prosopis cineraria TaxID=364024 RepID=UPI00240F15B5|nr:pentatricopeptide repeat-containing protein At3g04750, mitochondrial isoform X2 [Prosopis cineraria]